MANIFQPNITHSGEIIICSTKEYIQLAIKTGVVGFTINSVSEKNLLKLAKKYNSGSIDYATLDERYNNPVVGYSIYNGLKFSDPTQEIEGKLTIMDCNNLKKSVPERTEGSITYEPFAMPFNEEKDILIYTNCNIYTDESFLDIIKSYIFDGRNNYIYIGKRIKENNISKQVLEQVDPKMMYKALKN